MASPPKVKAHENWVEGLFTHKSHDKAIAEMSVSHLPALWKRKHAVLSEAIQGVHLGTIAFLRCYWHCMCPMG